MRVLAIPLIVVSVDKDLQDMIRSIADFELVGVIDCNEKVDTGGLKWLGRDDDWPRISSRYSGIKIALAVDSGETKGRLVRFFGINSLATVRSHDSYVAESVRLAAGALIQRGVKIFPDTTIGAACKLNVNATVHHDCQIGDYCTIAPGAQLLGHVVVEDRVFVGAGAIILPRVRVGAGSIIGAGAVVTADVSAGVVVGGVPARVLKNKGIR